ncbi:MAG: hypothetical protein QOJ02_2939 [Acidobacteriota bacterium]|jgi:hypothetical protein|nr:hypothetical protein [Acidobacteriota bacterium]
MAIIHPLVEGNLDEAAAFRIIEVTGHTPGTCYGKKGSGYIEQKVRSFNLTAHSTYYLALIDFMDTKLSCPPEVITNWLPNRQPKMLFRVVVREMESWLLADKDNLAEFLKVRANRIPTNPEMVYDPKLELINLARHSISSRIRSALVPEIGSTAQVGKLYNSEMRIFIDTLWNIHAARNYAPSLDRCLRRLESLGEED